MPFIRFITTCLLLTILMMAILGPGEHPWLTSEALWLAVLFAFCVWLMSLKRDFFLNTIAICFSFFFLQRIVVIYFRPDQMDYQEHLKFSSSVFTEAILFCIGISMAVLIGYFLALFPKKVAVRHGQNPVNFDKFLWFRYDFEIIFKLYSWFFICSWIFGVYLMFRFYVGVTAMTFDRHFAPLLRLVQIVQILNFLPMIVLVSGKFSSHTRKTALWLIVLILIKSIFLETGKGSLLNLGMAFFVSLFFCGKMITRKHAIIGGLLFLFTIFVLAPFATLWRWVGVRIATGVSSFEDILPMLANNYTLVLDEHFFSFMQRLGEFDWLTGFMTVGREAFMPMASIFNDFLGIIKSFIPGDFIRYPIGGITISSLMPHVLRGWNLGSYPGHGENMGCAGMAYLYFGQWGGIFFFLLWSFISVRFLKSSTNSIMNVLFFISIVITYVLAGDLITSVVSLFQGFLMFMLLIFLSKVVFSKSATVQKVT